MVGAHERAYLETRDPGGENASDQGDLRRCRDYDRNVLQSVPSCNIDDLYVTFVIAVHCVSSPRAALARRVRQKSLNYAGRFPVRATQSVRLAPWCRNGV